MCDYRVHYLTGWIDDKYGGRSRTPCYTYHPILLSEDKRLVTCKMCRLWIDRDGKRKAVKRLAKAILRKDE